jgi:hypothetical protein
MPQSQTRAFLPGQPLSPPAPIVQDLPPGGDPGQHLAKRTATNFDVEWVNPESGAELPPGGAIGEVLTKTGNLDGEADWQGLPPATGDDRAYIDAQDLLRVLKAGDTMTGPLAINAPAVNRLLVLTGELSPAIVIQSVANGGNIIFEEQGAQSWRVNATALGFWIFHDPVGGGAQIGVLAIDDSGIVNFLVPPRTTVDPVSDDDLVRKGYVDDQNDQWVFKGGDTMVGNLTISNGNSAGLFIDDAAVASASAQVVVSAATAAASILGGESCALVLGSVGAAGAGVRWRISSGRLTGGNHLVIARLAGLGTVIDTPLTVDYDTGNLLTPTAPTAPTHITNRAYVDSVAVPPGGAIGNILVKRSAADRDAAWIPSYHNEWLFIFAFNILGVESVGDIKTFVVPADAFPNFPFDWVMQGSGYGTCYASNRGGNNPVSGSNWTLNLIDPDTGTPFNMGTFQWAATNPWTAANQLVKFSPSTPMTSRVWHYDPAVSDTITFQAVAGTANPPAANLTIGFQGMIVAI